MFAIRFFWSFLLVFASVSSNASIVRDLCGFGNSTQADIWIDEGRAISEVDFRALLETLREISADGAREKHLEAAQELMERQDIIELHSLYWSKRGAVIGKRLTLPEFAEAIVLIRLYRFRSRHFEWFNKHRNKFEGLRKGEELESHFSDGSLLVTAFRMGIRICAMLGLKVSYVNGAYVLKRNRRALKMERYEAAEYARKWLESRLDIAIDKYVAEKNVPQRYLRRFRARDKKYLYGKALPELIEALMITPDLASVAPETLNPAIDRFLAFQIMKHKHMVLDPS